MKKKVNKTNDKWLYNKNFLNNQNYILGEKEKINVLYSVYRTKSISFIFNSINSFTTVKEDDIWPWILIMLPYLLFFYWYNLGWFSDYKNFIWLIIILVILYAAILYNLLYPKTKKVFYNSFKNLFIWVNSSVAIDKILILPLLIPLFLLFFIISYIKILVDIKWYLIYKKSLKFKFFNAIEYIWKNTFENENYLIIKK